MKRCCTCGEHKPVDLFPKCRSEKDGLKKRCKSCNNRANREYRVRNPETAAASSRNWALKNPQKVEAKKRRWAEKNPGRHAELIKRWEENNPERIAAFRRAYVTRADVRLRRTIRERIRQMVRGNKSRKTLEVLGYSMEDLRAHLERQFTDGMTWENFGKWHVDHIIPVAAFSIETENCPDLKAAWALANLRPLWAEENRKKHAKRLYLL